ncbi:amidohydrolase family protein [Sphingosinicella rhizophila]|uniref:Amidohydrolase family protein n=1 Tax=Sphingosinicella rhizophila TaxID=3050082 RepID=A0ABU3QB77_9SPHN|nr:amidohydrolase family protein [Sphingosinicella sp. GR2756]MDT9600631.1 amidohydrolase family protein [Sphingosinicella sp. GR2756]
MNALRIALLAMAGLSAALTIGSSVALAAERRLTVIMSGTPKGALIVEGGGPERRSTYSFRDRGRGPDLVTTRTQDERGVTLTLEVSGTDYRRMTAAERFATRAGTAEWESGADSGSAPAGDFYHPAEANDEDMAALARALLKSPGRTMGLLPAGTARIEKAEERRVSGAAGEAAITLYFISGMELQPVPIWLDAEGELFASGGNWLGVIRAGYEAAQPDLIAAQEQALAKAARNAASAVRHVPKGPLLIRGANLFDAERREMRPGMSVLIDGDRIVAVGPDGRIEAPSGSETIEAKGRALLPGLWDMHVHLLGQSDGLLAMATGVTTVRDLGNDVRTLKALADQFDAGTLIGPHVLKAGLIDGPGEFAGPTKLLAGTPSEAKAIVGRLVALGYPMVKLYSSLKPEVVRAAIAAAHARGLRVGGHVPAGMTLIEAVDAGFDEVQHANFWLLNFLGPEVARRTNTPARFTDAYRHGHEVDPEGNKVREFVAHLKARGTTLDPTLVTFESMFRGRKGELAAWMAPWADRLPAASLRGGRGGGRATDPQELATYRESFRRMEQLLVLLHQAGVPLVPGTDGSALLLSRELELHVEAGVPATDVLYSATLGAARVMKKDGETGSIAPGKAADLVLVDGDPSCRIGDVRRTSMIIKGGVIHDAAALAAAAGLGPAAANSRPAAPCRAAQPRRTSGAQ